MYSWLKVLLVLFLMVFSMCFQCGFCFFWLLRVLLQNLQFFCMKVLVRYGEVLFMVWKCRQVCYIDGLVLFSVLFIFLWKVGMVSENFFGVVMFCDLKNLVQLKFGVSLLVLVRVIGLQYSLMLCDSLMCDLEVLVRWVLNLIMFLVCLVVLVVVMLDSFSILVMCVWQVFSLLVFLVLV